MLHDINPFISLYKTAKERLDTGGMEGEEMRVLLNPQLRLILEVGADKRRHNLPTSDEVAMVIPAEYGESTFRDIVLASRGQNGEEFTIIDANHAAYMPLHYVLILPRGELGWHWGLELQNPEGVRQLTRLPQRAFYRYRLHQRQGDMGICYGPQALYTFPTSTYPRSLNPLPYIPVLYTYACSPRLILIT